MGPSATIDRTGTGAMWEPGQAGLADDSEASTWDGRPLRDLTSLNLGCGTDIRPDCVNLDRAALPGVDVVHDVAIIPFPFPAERFQRIVCQDVLEHIDLIPTMRELHRILAAGGTLEIRVPHFTCPNTYNDPTHVRAFSVETFNIFAGMGDRGYYFDFAFSSMEERRLSFTKSPSYFPNYLIDSFVNRSFKNQVFYERSVLRIFPAVNVHVRLRK
jgi:SAM-dependent methyltransferase